MKNVDKVVKTQKGGHMTQWSNWSKKVDKEVKTQKGGQLVIKALDTGQSGHKDGQSKPKNVPHAGGTLVWRGGGHPGAWGAVWELCEIRM